MSFKLLEGALSPAEGESVVRTYHTTSLSSGLLGLKAEGYLTVTTLRVVFYAFGSAFAGRSILQSEVPVADVSGITTYKGAHFSLTHLITAFIVSAVLSALISAILGILTTALVFAASSFELAPILALALAVAFLIASLASPTDKIRRPVFAACCATYLASIGGMGAGFAVVGSLAGNNLLGALGGLSTILALAAVIYAIVCCFLYARRETMALAIGSKGGSSTPIAISGITGFGLFSGAALRALTAEPAKDVERMIKELGAMITDIQALGEHGIDHWRESGASH
jgi:hypothetical protein